MSVNSSEQHTSSFGGFHSIFTVFLIISFLEKFIFTCFVCYWTADTRLTKFLIFLPQWTTGVEENQFPARPLWPLFSCQTLQGCEIREISHPLLGWNNTIEQKASYVAYHIQILLQTGTVGFLRHRDNFISQIYSDFLLVTYSSPSQ